MYKSLSIAVAAGFVFALAGNALAAGDVRSGYSFAQPETQAMQDDDFVNPGFLWVDQGEDLWSEVDGEADKSCASCHGESDDATMKGVAANYPQYRDALGKLINIEQQINACRVDQMQAKAWKWESTQLLSMTSYLRNQSRGMLTTVAIDGPSESFFKKGKAFYYKRRGLLDMACANCHVDNWGKMLRANMLTQGQTTGFPVYRLKWQKVGSTHRRFRGCNKQVRATPYGYGSDEYVNLELFLAWRSRTLPIDSPAVRN